MSLTLLHTTPHEVLVWKPPGLAVERPRDPAADSLVHRLRTLGHADVRLVHRLDAPASGLVLVACTRESAAHHAAEIAARRWHKTYVATVSGRSDDLQHLVGRHRAYLRIDGPRARIVRAGGKPSFLRVLAVVPAPGHPLHSHVLVRLETGRFHQIRVMLASLGAPLVGDDLYGGAPDAALYLEQVVLGLRLFGDAGRRVWSAPEGMARPVWSDHLTRAVTDDADAAAVETA